MYLTHTNALNYTKFETYKDKLILRLSEKEIEDVYTALNVYVFWILTGKECDIRLPVLYDSLQLHHSYFSVCYCG